MDVRELAPGLWWWRGGGRARGSVYWESGDAVRLVDPHVPEDEPERFFRHLDADVARLELPVVVHLTRPGDDATPFLERYDARVEGVDGLPDDVLAAADGPS